MCWASSGQRWVARSAHILLPPWNLNLFSGAGTLLELEPEPSGDPCEKLAFILQVYEAYGQTECTAGCTYTTPGDWTSGLCCPVIGCSLAVRRLGNTRKPMGAFKECCLGVPPAGLYYNSNTALQTRLNLLFFHQEHSGSP